MAARAFLLIALAAFLFTGIVRAGDAPKLTGSMLKIEEAVTKSGAIFVGQFTSFGKKGAIGPGESELFGNHVKVSQDLKATFDDGATVAFNRMTDLGEQKPATKVLYIFFMTKNAQTEPDPFTVLKLVPATNDNIAIVMKLISS